MNNIEIFKNKIFGEIRTLLINDEVWFVGKDVAEALGYSDTFGALKKHIDNEDKQNCQNDSFGTPRGMTIINESGLYSLILSSKLPQAKEFKRWVTNEILPTLRKTGVYKIQPKTPMEILELEFQAIKEIDKKVDEVVNDFGKFKLEMPVLALDIDKIIKAKNKIAVTILGGKDSEAYKDVNLRSTLYRDIERGLRRQFSIHTHKELKRCEVDKAVEFIKNYKPPFYLSEEIEAKNRQQEFLKYFPNSILEIH